jgi:hypothetical protein
MRLLLAYFRLRNRPVLRFTMGLYRHKVTLTGTGHNNRSVWVPSDKGVTSPYGYKARDADELSPMLCPPSLEVLFGVLISQNQRKGCLSFASKDDVIGIPRTLPI